MFATTYKYNETVIITNVKDIEFKTIGKTTTELGWKSIILEEKSTEGKKEDKIKALPSLFKGENVLSVIRHKECITTPPKHFTEGTLITAMKNVGKIVENEEEKEILRETEGIGTEATRANVIETLKHQQYITVQKNNVVVTEKGNILCDVIKNREISKPELTAKWENYLKKIHEGTGTQTLFLKSIENFIKFLIENVPGDINTNSITQKIMEKNEHETIGKCPKCNSQVKEKSKVYSCSNNDCDFVLYKKLLNKKLSVANAKLLLTKGESKIIKGLKGNSGKEFDAALKLDNNGKTSFIFSKK